MTSFRSRFRLGWFLWLAAAVLFAGAAVTAYQTYRAASDLQAAATDLQAMAKGDPASADLQAVGETVHRARLDAEFIRSRAQLVAPLTDHLGWLPRYGPMLAASAPMADYVASLTAAGDDVLSGLEPLLMSSGQASETSLSARLVESLVSAGPQLDSAEAELKHAQAARLRFSREDLPARFQGDMEQVDRMLPLASSGLTILRQMPGLLGAPSPRTYLVVAQNQDELRATGGFISGIGTIDLDAGRIAHLSIGNSYSVDNLNKIYPAPPEPLQRYMLAEQWLVRDANWSPDFPTSAAQIQKLYAFSTGGETDGVIAFDLTAVARILAVTGPVSLAGLPQPVGADNVETYVHQAWGPAPGEGVSQAWWQHRKDFMGQLGSAILAKLQTSSDRSTMLKLARQTLALVREKHVLIYVDDPQASEVLSNLGLDGALDPGSGDFLMVVDSNVGFNKMDARIERQLSYTIDLRRPDAPQASAAMRYRNPVASAVACRQEASYGTGAYEDMQLRCYWDYVRVYTPAGAALLGGGLPPTPGSDLLNGRDQSGAWESGTGEHGTKVFGGMLVVPTHQQVAWQLEYRMPPGIVLETPDGSLEYRLHLSKQAGTEGVRAEVSLLLPEGAQVQEAPGWTTPSPGTYVWDGRLVTDVNLSLTWRR